MAARQGSLDEARELLDEALDLSLAAGSTRRVARSLSAYAWVAFAGDDPERGRDR